MKKHTGFEIILKIHWSYWFIKPRLAWDFGQPYFKWLCFTIRGKGCYLYTREKEGKESAVW